MWDAVIVVLWVMGLSIGAYAIGMLLGNSPRGRWLPVVGAVFATTCLSVVAYAGTLTYLWAVVPAAIEVDWRDHPAAATVSAQVTYYAGDANSEDEAPASRVITMPSSLSITAVPWQRMWTEYDAAGNGWVDFRAPDTEGL